jgi:RES domain-containing protein
VASLRSTPARRHPDGSARRTASRTAIPVVRVLVSTKLRLTKLLDLVDPRGLQLLPWVGLQDLLAEDWRKVNDTGHEAQSQALGRAAYNAGAGGILVPSARVPGGINLVYFPDALTRSGEVTILGEDELARWLKKR